MWHSIGKNTEERNGGAQCQSIFRRKQKRKDTVGSYAARLKSSTPLQQQLADVSRLQA